MNNDSVGGSRGDTEERSSNKGGNYGVIGMEGNNDRENREI